MRNWGFVYQNIEECHLDIQKKRMLLLPIFSIKYFFYKDKDEESKKNLTTFLKEDFENAKSEYPSILEEIQNKIFFYDYTKENITKTLETIKEKAYSNNLEINYFLSNAPKEKIEKYKEDLNSILEWGNRDIAL